MNHALFTIFKVLATIAALVVAVALVIFFGVFVLGFAAFILAVFVLYWASGARITLYQHHDKVKTPIGHVRWFTFTRY